MVSILKSLFVNALNIHVIISFNEIVIVRNLTLFPFLFLRKVLLLISVVDLTLTSMSFFYFMSFLKMLLFTFWTIRLISMVFVLFIVIGTHSLPILTLSQIIFNNTLWLFFLCHLIVYWLSLNIVWLSFDAILV